MQKKRDFLVNIAYWGIIAAAVYLGLEYLLPITMPFCFGILIAVLVVWISRKVHLENKLFRILVTVVLYGIIGLLVVLLAAKGGTVITGIVRWLPQVYEKKLLPLADLVYSWTVESVRMLDPAMIDALAVIRESILSALQDLISGLSGVAVGLVSGLASGIPNLILSLLAMIFSTVFVAGDYERIADFAHRHIPPKTKKLLLDIREYLTDTLLVVIRSYGLIMLLTFTELSILFSLFGIQNAVLKASLIAMLDILPILGTGGIMIPWAIISIVLGNLGLGLRLLLIYGIVTVVRNYLEPKIVGTQLGIHPIVTLVSMFIGLRLFGFWGLFGLPVGISFLWKRRQQPS